MEYKISPTTESALLYTLRANPDQKQDYLKQNDVSTKQNLLETLFQQRIQTLTLENIKEKQSTAQLEQRILDFYIPFETGRQQLYPSVAADERFGAHITQICKNLFAYKNTIAKEYASQFSPPKIVAVQRRSRKPQIKIAVIADSKKSASPFSLGHYLNGIQSTLSSVARYAACLFFTCVPSFYTPAYTPHQQLNPPASFDTLPVVVTPVSFSQERVTPISAPAARYEKQSKQQHKYTKHSITKEITASSTLQERLAAYTQKKEAWKNAQELLSEYDTILGYPK